MLLGEWGSSSPDWHYEALIYSVLRVQYEYSTLCTLCIPSDSGNPVRLSDTGEHLWLR